MLDIKNMNDEQIVNLIKLLKHELETRRTNKPYMFPTGVIRLTLESSITNDKGQVFQNDPKKIFFETASSQEIDAIFNQDGIYPILVNQLVDRFKESMWEQQTGPLKITREDINCLYHIKDYFKCRYPDDKYIELLDKILIILGGK